MTNEIMVLDEKVIKDKIHTIRGIKVMLDSDLAEIYGYTTKNFNRQVKNNIEKFDDVSFMFQLTEDEYLNLRCNNFTSSSNINTYGGRRYLPYAFTEQGVYMLMTVLKGELAIKQSKSLILIFKRMKDYITSNNRLISYEVFSNLSMLTHDNTREINNIKKELKKDRKANSESIAKIMKLLSNYPVEKEILIKKNGYIEADLVYERVYSLAKKSIYIIDDYISVKTLSLLKCINKKINVIIFSDNVGNKLSKIEYNDFHKQYPDISITFKVTNNMVHDRFIIVDYGLNTERLFICGSSSKDSGNKITTITEWGDHKIVEFLMINLFNNEQLVLK